MGKPAVNTDQRTAGEWTKRIKKTSMAVIAGTAILTLCAFTPAEAAVKKPTAPEVRTTTTAQKVPFDTTYIDLPNQYRGYEVLVSEGVMGEKEIQAQVVYQGDRLVKVLSIKASEKARPVNKVIKRGTKELRSQTADGRAWKTSFANPLKTGWLSADFHDYKGHNGIDLAAPYGTPVYAAAEGTVTLAGWYGEYGRCVIISHADGSQTLYAHNSAIEIQNGQKVKQGQLIARIGSTGNSTGNHLHFEIRVGGTFLDPLIYMDK